MRSETELRRMRMEAVRFLRQIADEYGLKVEPIVFTCDDCPEKYTCEWVYDPYNIRGDCLAEK